MSARLMPPVSNLVDLPSVADKHFLSRVIQELSRLQGESERRGHRLLTALIEIAKSEAEDDLKTRSQAVRLFSQKHRPLADLLDLDESGDEADAPRGEDEGMLRIAHKLAWRRGASAA